MTRTAYILSGSTLSTSGLDFVSDNFKNIFDIIIDKKAKMSLLKMGFSENNLLKITRFINTLKRTDFGSRNYLFTPDVLFAYKAKSNEIEKIKSIDSDLMNIIKKVYSGTIYISSNTLLKQLMNSCDEFIQDINNDDTYLKEIILFYLFSKKQVDAQLFYKELNTYLSSLKINFPDGFSLMGTVIELIQEGYIQTGWGKYIFPSNSFYASEYVRDSTRDSFREYISIDFEYSDILRRRFKGDTLENLGQEYGLSRERIRQIQNKFLFIFKDTMEYVRYKKIFEKYKISKDNFTFLFNEPEDTYYFLNVMCNSGSEELNYSDMISDSEFNRLKVPIEKMKKFIPVEVKSTKNKIERFLEKYDSIEFQSDTFCHLYNSYVTDDDNLKLTNMHSIEGIIAKSEFAISGNNRSFRFYNLKRYHAYIPYLESIIKDLPSGYYSTYKIFRDNKELMMEMNLKNHYELHNFIRKNSKSFDSIMTLSKSPSFYIQISSKPKFVERELLKFKGNKKSDFIHYIHDNFGLTEASFRAYFDNNFHDYSFDERKNDYMVLETKSFNEDNQLKFESENRYENIEKIQSKFVDNIYIQEKFEKLIEAAHVELNDWIIKKLNYVKKGDAYYRNKFDSLTEALEYQILKSTFENKLYENALKSRSVRSCLRGLQSEMRVFRIEKDAYCTIEYLKGININIIDIKSFIRNVIQLAKSQKFFSIHSIFDELDGDRLITFCFDEIFYDEIINYANILKVIKKASSSGQRLYSLDEDLKLYDFLADELSLLGNKSDIDDFIYQIARKYKIEVSKKTVMDNIEYYAEDLEVVYNNKQDYYNDIYGG